MVVNLEAEFPEEQWNDLMIDTGSLAAQNFKERMEKNVRFFDLLFLMYMKCF